MKILFVNPSLRLGHPTKYLPVGIASVMTFVQEHGFKFDLLDIDINNYDNQAVEEFLANNQYDVVLSGCIVTHYKWMKWLTRTIKSYYPKTKIVIGNSVAGSIPEVFLRNSSADIAVIGEGEFTTLELLNALRDQTSIEAVEGIAYLDADGRFVKTPKRRACKIDDLPLVNWDLFDFERYFKHSYAGADGLVFDKDHIPRVMPVATARGCVFKCTFCHYVFWDDPYRHRSPDSVLKEVRRNLEKYGATYINFWDDLSFSSLRQVESMTDAILASGLKFNWNAAIRCDLFGNPKFPYEHRLRLAKQMKEAGCCNVGFSLESGNQDILNMMNKKIKSDYFHEQVSVLKDAGISLSTSVVFGYPIETPQSIADTFEQCLKVGVYPSIGYLLPLPYTKMYDYAKEQGYIGDDNAYLDSITERQDLCINMTKMGDSEVMSYIKEYAQKLNESLALGLSNDRLVKTGGYMYQKTESARNPRPLIDPENIRRNCNDVSFNYSQATFSIDLGVKSAELRPETSIAEAPPGGS